jgi:lysozyme
MSAATGIIRQHKGKLTGSAAALALMSALILHWEGEKLVASHNSIDPPGIIDVCNGITNRELPWLKAGMKFTHEDCEALRLRLMPKYRDPLKKCIKGYEDMPPA